MQQTVLYYIIVLHYIHYIYFLVLVMKQYCTKFSSLITVTLMSLLALVTLILP